MVVLLGLGARIMKKVGDWHRKLIRRYQLFVKYIKQV